MKKKDLEFFKKLLSEKKETMLAELSELAEEANNDGPSDEGDLSVSEVNQHLSFEMKSRERKYIKEIDDALKRIEAGTYGLCESCDIDISIPRLKASPIAKLCIECQEDAEKDSRRV